MRIVAITGLTASGKTYALEYYKKAGKYTIDLGEVVRSTFEQYPLKNYTDIITFSQYSHQLFGKHWTISSHMHELIKHSEIYIGGIRFLEQIQFLRLLTSDVTLIQVNSRYDLRLNRFLIRRRMDFNSTATDFQNKERLELNLWEIEKVFKISDIIIENNDSLQGFEDKLSKFN